MKRAFIKRFLVIGVALLSLPLFVIAQQSGGGQNKKVVDKKDVEQIIINRVVTKDSKSNEKTVIEIQGDKIVVNGKEMKSGSNTVQQGDVTVHRNQLRGFNTYVGPGGQGWTMNSDAFSIFNEDANRAMLGVNTEYNDKGARIVSLVEGSAAEKAGLKKDDIITKIGKEKISETNEITEVIREHKPGDKIAITVLRNGKEQVLNAELSKWKGVRMNGVMAPGREFLKELNPMLDGQNFRVMSPSITEVDALRTFYGNTPKLGLSIQDTEDGKGVKVIEIDEDGNAAKAGLKEDDIITHLNTKEVNSADEISRLMKENKEKATVTFKVQRNGKSQDVEVRIPRKLKSADL